MFCPKLAVNAAYPVVSDQSTLLKPKFLDLRANQYLVAMQRRANPPEKAVKAFVRAVNS